MKLNKFKEIAKNNLKLDTIILFILAYGLIFYNYGLKAACILFILNWYINAELRHDIEKSSKKDIVENEMNKFLNKYR